MESRVMIVRLAKDSTFACPQTSCTHATDISAMNDLAELVGHDRYRTSRSAHSGVGYLSRTFVPAVCVGQTCQPFSTFGVDPTAFPSGYSGQLCKRRRRLRRTRLLAASRHVHTSNGMAFGHREYLDAGMPFTGAPLKSGLSSGTPDARSIAVESVGDLTTSILPNLVELWQRSAEGNLIP
jgi:hypothetical protein